MKSNNQNRTLGIGLLIILAGLAILFHRLNVFSPQVDDIIISWQMLLIVIGVWNLFFTQSRVAGIILVAVGSFFLIPDLFILPHDFRRNFWPLLLIVVGLFILFRAMPSRKREPIKPTYDGDPMEFIDETNIFSGSEKKVFSQNFRGGKVTSLFGGSEIDLSGSQLADGTNVLEVFYMFGGSTIIVPNDWVVINKVTSILGGFSDKRGQSVSTQSNPQRTLILQGFVMFGGGEIKGR
jgi:predicted membrane protein